jgi:glycosyltransferase involved in cell wall biosynthesis
MRIHVNPHYLAHGKTGKGRFAQRLVRAWKDMGVDVSQDPLKKADIALHIGRFNYPAKAKKHVIRVGPANVNTNMNWRRINREKAESIKKCDAVIYQSLYSRKIYHKLVCKPHRPETIIVNGADPRDYDVQPYKTKYKYLFLASTRVWLKQKRLKEIAKSFLQADIPESCLLVAGDTQGVNKRYRQHRNIVFAGPVKDAVLASMYRVATALIHAVWVDACPNTVVEAQVAGCPVICTDQGGTPEVAVNGVVIKDKPFPFKAVNLDKPPALDREAFACAMRMYCGHDIPRSPIQTLYIEHVAKAYLKFFEEIL